MFGWLVTAAKSRDINLREVIPYEFSSVPFSIAHIDGTLRKTSKSDLLAELEKPISDEIQLKLPAPTSGMTTTYLTDAMAVIQMLKSGGVSTFDELANKLYKFITLSLGTMQCKRVDVVFDRYLGSVSEDRWKEWTWIIWSTRGTDQKSSYTNSKTVAKVYKKYAKHSQPKCFPCFFMEANSWGKVNEGEELVIGGGFADPNQAVKVRKGVLVHIEELHSDPEEADTRLLLHDKHAARDHRRIVIQSPDTDVSVLCVSHFRDLSVEEVWFCTGVKDKMRYIPVHMIDVELKEKVCTVLPAFHALTGCDSTSSLLNVGKRKPWQVLIVSTVQQTRLAELGMEIPPSDTTLKACETFICQFYRTNDEAGTTADEV